MKAGTAGRRTGKRATGVALIPEARPLFYVEGHALSEVSSLITWRDSGLVELRLATGPATRRGEDEHGGYSLDIRVRERDKDENDVDRIDEMLHFRSMEAVVAMHLALALLIEQARESGWHNLKVEAVVSGGLPKFLAIVEG